MLIQKIAGRMRYETNRLFNWLRLCRAALVTLLVRTHVRRWQKVAQGGRPPWDERNELIAGFIPAGSSVLDIGSGAQTLKQHLKPGCKYQPCDVVQSSPDVIFCDFNAGIYPEIKQPSDYVVCSGVFEYIRQPEEFLRRIPLLGKSVILSYYPFPPGGSKLERLGNNWVNHFTSDELENLFAKAGLSWKILFNHEKIGYVVFLLGPKS